MPRHALDVARLYAALDAERQRQGETWSDVAKATGISASTFSRLAEATHRPDADALCTMLMWLGLSLRQFIRPEEAP